MNLNPYEVKSKEDLIRFIISLKGDLIGNEKQWENPTLMSYLEGMESWLSDTGEITEPNWRVFAIILSAGKGYE